MKDLKAWEEFDACRKRTHNFVSEIITFCKVMNVEFPSIIDNYNSITFIWSNLYLDKRLEVSFTSSGLVTFRYCCGKSEDDNYTLIKAKLDSISEELYKYIESFKVL